MLVEALKQSPLMNHMVEALARGEDIGHYSRLTVIMIARHSVDNEELVGLLTQDRDADEGDKLGDGAAGRGERLQPAPAGSDPGVAVDAGLPDRS